MKPLILLRRFGFLLRVVDNEAYSYRYEWTIEGATPATKKFMREEYWRGRQQMAQVRYMRPLRKRDPERDHYYIPRRLNSTVGRLYDPTSMPTLRGRYSALDYGFQELYQLVRKMKNRENKNGMVFRNRNFRRSYRRRY